MQQNISTFLEVMKYAEKDDVMRGDYISPLHLAVVKNDRTMIELLLKKEADPSWTVCLSPEITSYFHLISLYM